MDRDHLQYFRDLYDAFNRRDADAVLARTTGDVDWPNAWKGGRLTGHDAVRAYWSEQWAEIGPRVEPLSAEPRADGRVAVTVRQTIRSRDGALLGDQEVIHLYTLRGVLIARMDVETAAAQ
ncbi:MAG TPA: nuclear transport factor 2 family protein [Solirubrobacteraceae bacterium]|nr:nuclear transport factor 2 family protein [Solirubrobacteraceae bacterium]